MLSKEITLCLYIIAFGIPAIVFQRVSDGELKGRYSTYSKSIVLAIAIMAPVFMAGFRACGTDIYTYTRAYNRSLNEPIRWFWQENGSTEVIFLLLSKFARGMNSIRILFTCCALITVIPVYKSIWEKRDTILVGYAIFTFMFTFFPTSWNIVRQFMAVGIIAYSYRYIFEKKLIMFLFFTLIATACHTSAIIMIPIYFLWSKDGELITDLRLWIAVIGLLVGVLSIQQIMGGRLTGVLSEYETYLVNDRASGNRDFFLNIFVLIVLFCFGKNLAKLDKRNKFYMLMLLFQCIIGLTGFRTPFIKRVGIYFGITQIYLFGALPLAVKDSRTRLFIKMGIIAFVIAQFWFVDYYLNQPKIVPYKWEFPKGLID